MFRPNAIYRALADPTRRAILKILRSGPRTSGEIAERFPIAWATVSRHLAVLREAGLVTTERDKNSIRYELNTTVFQQFAEQVLELAATRSSQEKDLDPAADRRRVRAEHRGLPPAPRPRHT